jgi:hypothetical protein
MSKLVINKPTDIIKRKVTLFGKYTIESWE